ncbi:MAG: hypothetical protein IKE65_06210 [Clostridia bacterium]|nr:hypothetical protein [Clostridia bacterium]
MAKRLYSLMLNDEVVRAVDAEAHRLATNRSALIDSVLADYFGVSTAQKRMTDIFAEMDALLASSEHLIPFFAPHSGTFYMKSALSYKYRPTLKYELVLDQTPARKLGDLSVNFRTQSASLVRELEQFFKLWAHIEQQVLGEQKGAHIEYALYPNRFIRSMALPEGADYSAHEIAAAVSAYVNLFDTSLKAYLNGTADAEDITRDYESFIENAAVVL